MLAGYSEFNKYERILQTYSLDEILEENEVTQERVLQFLVEWGIIELPQIKPVDVQ